MKFIHLSNIGIGNSCEGGTDWESERSEELFSSLERVLAKAEEDGAALLLITGGLFCGIPTAAVLEKTASIFRAHPAVSAVMIGGAADPVLGSSLLRSFEWPEQVHMICSGEPACVQLPSLSAEVYGLSVTDREGEPQAEKLAEAILEEKEHPAIRIGMLCAGEEDADTLRRAFAEAFETAGLSYLAVGSGKLNREIEKDRIYAPENLEPADEEDHSEHGLLEGELSEETGKLTGISFVPFASAGYVAFSVRIRPETTQESLTRGIRTEIERRGAKNIYRLRFIGKRNPDFVPDLTELKKQFRISELKDETEPEYDFSELFREHPQDMIGFFISRIASGKKEMSPIEKKAMYYGISALLKTSGDENR